MAMHVHSSFSEGTGSMFWQLDQAKRSGLEVVWWTDHDFRMSAWQYRKAIHCSGTSEPEDGHALTWSRTTNGSLQIAGATFLAAASSPGDPDTTAGLHLDASSTSSSFAWVRMTAQDAKARHNLHASLAGQSIVVDVSPESIGPDAFLEVRVQLSDQPASGGRTAGSYYLYYRVGGPNAPGSVIKQVRGGTITYAAPTGAWTTLVLTPANDIARLWPDLQATDAALCQLSVAVGSRRGARATGNIDNIRFQRTTSGSAPLQAQRTIGDALAPQFPGVTQHQGLEVSLYPRHLNWYGGTVVLPDYGTAGLSPVDDLAKTRDLVRMVHDGGGLASYNHMFGTGFGMTPLSTTKQETARINVAKQLVQNAAFGADILEVGYRMRGGVTLDRHLSVWDVCSRNGLFLTGNGVNDSHEGAWSGSGYTFVTSAWAEDAKESSLVGALAAGRCTFHDQDRFRGRSISPSTAPLRWDLFRSRASRPAGSRSPRRSCRPVGRWPWSKGRSTAPARRSPVLGRRARRFRRARSMAEPSRWTSTRARTDSSEPRSSTPQVSSSPARTRCGCSGRPRRAGSRRPAASDPALFARGVRHALTELRTADTLVAPASPQDFRSETA